MVNCAWTIAHGPWPRGVSICISIVRRPMVRPICVIHSSSEPLQDSGRLCMSPTQGSRCAANPGLSKSSPSGNNPGRCWCAVNLAISLCWITSGVSIPHAFVAQRCGGPRMNAQRRGRPTRIGYPSVRVSSDERSAERTQRSAPPRRWFWTLAAGCLCVSGLGFPVHADWLPIGAGVLG